LNKRRAVIIDEELNENSNLYIIKAHLPLIESFGFYKEIMKNTSGRISSQLIFDTWKI
jgi:translation elongation factor EF-G